jgi:hypothetical protein
MSTKDKALPYIDARSTARIDSPHVRKVTFNPYTGGMISNNTDRPNFGKYTMELRSGTKFTSCVVNFKKPEANGKTSIISMQIPIPNVKLLVKNPNYELVDAIVYLALTQEALAGVDNGGVFDQIGRVTRPEDFYVSFSPNKSSPIIKRTITISVNDKIVQLFEKYTIYQFLEIMTGSSYSDVTNNNELIQLVQDNLKLLELYGEAGFNNDSDSTNDGYFIRNKLITRFSFDKSYLDNPSLGAITVTANKDSIYIKFKEDGLRTIKLSIFAGPTASFNYATDTPIKTVSLTVAGKTNYNYTVPLSDLTAAAFNDLSASATEATLNAIINSRKYIAVRITSVVVSAGIEKLPNEFKEFFGVDPNTGTTKVVMLKYNVPAPILATFTESTITKPPYFLDLVANARKFYFLIKLPASKGFDPKSPAGISGILIKYVNNPGTSTVGINTLRYFPLSSSQVNLEREGQVPSGKTDVEYYYSITDYFKRPASSYNSYKLDVPYASKIEVYLVDNYYYTSNAPLNLPNTGVQNLVNYFNQPSNGFFKFSGLTRLIFNFNFLQKIPRHTLSFKLFYTPAKSSDTAPPTGVTWSFWGSYTFSVLHNYGTMINYKAIAAKLYTLGGTEALSDINLAAMFANTIDGQGFWIKFELIPYTSSEKLPYTGSVLGVIKQVRTDKK